MVEKLSHSKIDRRKGRARAALGELKNWRSTEEWYSACYVDLRGQARDSCSAGSEGTI